MIKTVAIHQPNYLPWIGYFHKIHVSDVFVFLDHVEYSERSWINRNKIKTPDGWTWLTVPVNASNEDRILDIEVDDSQSWRDEHRKSFEMNYGGADYYNEFGDILLPIYKKDWKYLHRLNRHLIKEISDAVGLQTEFRRSSELDVEGEATDLILNICGSLNADEYYSGQGAKDYTREELFEETGIELTYQDIEHPEYPQRFDGFESHMSFADMVFNVGVNKAYDIIDDL